MAVLSSLFPTCVGCWLTFLFTFPLTHQQLPRPPVTPEVIQYQCEDLTTIDLCANIYSHASFPNYRGHEDQVSANRELLNFTPLIQSVCSNAIVHFLCSIYAPFCQVGRESIRVRPCKELCVHVRSTCEQPLQEFNLNWPPHLDCDNFMPNATTDKDFCPIDIENLKFPENVTTFPPPRTTLPPPRTTSDRQICHPNCDGCNINGTSSNDCERCADGFYRTLNIDGNSFACVSDCGDLCESAGVCEACQGQSTERPQTSTSPSNTSIVILGSVVGVLSLFIFLSVVIFTAAVCGFTTVRGGRAVLNDTSEPEEEVYDGAIASLAIPLEKVSGIVTVKNDANSARDQVHLSMNNDEDIVSSSEADSTEDRQGDNQPTEYEIMPPVAQSSLPEELIVEHERHFKHKLC